MSQGKTGCGRIFLVLFALPFAGVGVFGAVMAGWSLADWWRMQDWVEVPATILEADLKTHRGSDSTTYQATAGYEYSFDGRRYQGDRVGIHNKPDNIGNYHQEIAHELERYQQSGQPFRCYVNPDDPSEAVLYRRVRVELVGFFLLFALIFGGVGFGLIFWSIYSRRLQQRGELLTKEHPGQPWLWQPEWAEGSIKSSTKTVMVVSLVMAVFWNLVSAPLWFFLPQEMAGGNRLALLGLIFPVVGVGLIVWAVRNVWSWWKYGASLFQMASLPGVIGGPLAGVVRAPVHMEPAEGFRVTLSCINEVTTGSGKNRSTRKNVLWQDLRVLDRELAPRDMSQSAIPILFHIPYDSRPTSFQDSHNKIIWRLEVKADVPGLDYAASFDVPVFKTPDSSPDFKLDTSSIAQYEAASDPAARLGDAGVRVEHTAAGRRFVFPAARQLGAAVGLTIFLLIWIGAIILMINLGAPILFPIVFGFFAVLLLFGVVDLWLWSGTIDVAPGRISVAAGIPLFRRSRTFAADEVQAIRPSRGMQTGNKLYYGLRLETQDGKHYTVAKRIPSRADAEYLAEQLLGDSNWGQRTRARN